MPGALPHICFVAPNAFPLLSGLGSVEFIGGAELQQVLIAKELAARGYRVSMICLDFGQVDGVTIDGISVLRAFDLKAGIPVLRFVWPRLVKIWASLKRADADIYYQRAASVWTGVMALFCRWHRKKCVFAVAGNPDLEPVTPRIRYGRDRWIYKYGLRHVDRILVQNLEQASMCRQHHGLDAVLVPNLYLLPSDRQMCDRHKVLWVSTIREIKRPELFLDLAQELPELEFRMIGGPGRNEAALYEAIRQRASGIHNLEFLGFVPYSRIEDYFDDAALLVNTSESEGFPNAFLQAWARGIPTVSFVDAGARLEGKPVGLTTNSIKEMIATVAGLISSDARRLEEGRRGAKYVVRNHSPKSIVELYKQIFEDLARVRGPQRSRSKFRNESTDNGDSDR
jgi:glycosyltransferase involved in cell wall biosynthesis